jgi:hypothetical protein
VWRLGCTASLAVNDLFLGSAAVFLTGRGANWIRI